jgi:signal transduction histidine kinase/PAS domain-containing protein
MRFRKCLPNSTESSGVLKYDPSRSLNGRLTLHLIFGMKAAMAAGRPSQNEEEVIFADDGHRELLETIKTPMHDHEGRLVGVLGISRDITQRKQAEKTRRYHERLLREMGNTAKVGGWEFDPASGQGTWTEEVARIHDLDPCSETDMELGLSFYQGESRIKIENAIKAAIEFGEPFDLELELLSAKGAHKWVHTIGRPKTENGKVVQVRGSFQDITASKAAEQRIGQLNRVLQAIRHINQLIVRERSPDTLIREASRLLVDNRGYVSALIVRTDENDNPISWANAGLASSAGLPDTLLERGELPPCWDRVRSGKEVVLMDDNSDGCGMCPVTERRTVTRSLCARLTHGGANYYGYLAVALNPNMTADDEERSLFTEITRDLSYALHALQSESNRSSLEKQLIQSQRLESVGRLAGGVAHDYNNILSVILGYTELALDRDDLPGGLHDDLKEIYSSAGRSRDITRQLLAFARKQTIYPVVLDLNVTIESMLRILRRLIGEDIDLAWLPGKGLWPIMMDPSQVDQILANLCVNARDAISDVGKVTIETGTVALDKEYCSEHTGFTPGDFVVLSVSDDGCGMDRDTLGKIFEPFFTTKGVGKGTGLGLATVYGIVKQNNGFINVYSEPDEGTAFRIYLPRNAGDIPEGGLEVRVETTMGRGELLLVVEDDVPILKLAERILSRLNYKVLQ